MSNSNVAVSDHLAKFLSDADRAAIRAPIEEARTFPQHAYWSPSYFELEVERLFSRNWVAVGFASSLPQPGDMAPLEIFGFPICLVRGADKTLRVFHNIGVHDASTVILERQSAAAGIVGPYHGWRYDLQGHLIAAPYWDGTPDPDITSLRERGGDLKEIRSQVWQDIVFMDLSGKCDDLERHLVPVVKLFEDHELDSFQLAFDAPDGDGIQRRSPQVNWKTLWGRDRCGVTRSSSPAAVTDPVTGSETGDTADALREPTCRRTNRLAPARIACRRRSSHQGRGSWELRLERRSRPEQAAAHPAVPARRCPLVSGRTRQQQICRNHPGKACRVPS